MKYFFVFVTFVSLIGCAASNVLNTPSGKPEVVIEKKSKKEVADALVSEMVSSGYAIKSVSDYNIVFGKLIDNNLAASLLFGSRYDITPEYRPSFAIFETDAGVRIVLTNQIVTNPGSGYEHVTDANGGAAGKSWQEFLAVFPNVFKGRTGIRVDKNGTVLDVIQGSPAMTEGIQKADRLVTVDSVPYSDISQLIGEPDSMVNVVVRRNGKELAFAIKRKVLK